MIQLTPQMRFLLVTEPVDFRGGIDRFCAYIRKNLLEDPMNGTVFIFRSRNRKALRFLIYDGQGYWLCHKRFSEGRLKYWPGDGRSENSLNLYAHEAQLLMIGGRSDPRQPVKYFRDFLDSGIITKR